MQKLLLIIVIIILSTGVVLGQKGTAEPDFYPPNYYGDTWTGIVTTVNEDTREFTLSYKKKDKEEIFVGILPKGYTQKMADGKDREVKLDDLLGMQLRAYYISRTKKVNDQKIKYNDVFKIKILKLAKP